MIAEDEDVELIQEVKLIGTTDTGKIDFNQGILTYTDPIFVKLRTKALIPDFIKPYDFEIELDEDEYEVDDLGDFTANISTTREDVEINRVRFIFSSNVKTEEAIQLNKKDNIFTWNGKEDEKLDFLVKFTPQITGNLSVEAIVDYKYEGLTGTYKEKVISKLHLEKPEIDLNVPRTVNGGDTFNVSFSVTGTEHEFKEIDIELASTYFNVISYPFSKLSPEKVITKVFPITAPKTSILVWLCFGCSLLLSYLFH